MAKEIPIAPEDAAAFDELTADGEALEVSEARIAAAFQKLHSEFINKRRKVMRMLYVKYGLDTTMDATFETGPNPEDNKIILTEKMPEHAN